jgi:hypothetical protein
MAKTAVEFDPRAFIQMRFRELGIDRDPDELFVWSGTLRTERINHRFKELWAISLGSVGGLLGFGTAVEQISTRSITASSVALSVALVLGAVWALHFWFHSEAALRFAPKTNDQLGRVSQSVADFAKVLEPVKSGGAQLALMSSSGIGIAFSPVSNRPIEKFIADEALADAWLACDVLHLGSEEPRKGNQQKAVAPEYIVIVWQDHEIRSVRAEDRWKRYYLWHLEHDYVADVFDRASSIYFDDDLKRKKARFAVLFVNRYFAECAATGSQIRSQLKLAKALGDQLKLEANRQLHAQEMDHNEARMFERMGMSGKAKETDPSELRSQTGDGSDGWFEQLLSGINKQISPALRNEVLKDFPTLEEFKSK